MISLASPLPGVQRDRLDLLGKWAKSASLVYDQSIGQVIAGLQVLVTEAADGVGAYYSEHDMAGKITLFLSARFGADVEEVKGHVESFMIDRVAAVFMSAVETAPLELPAGSASSSAPNNQVLNLAEIPLVLPDDTGDADVEERAAPYWLSISEKTGFKRLHRRGGCWYTSRVIEQVWDLSEVHYNAACERCWKPGVADPPKISEVLLELTGSPSVHTDSESSSSSC